MTQENNSPQNLPPEQVVNPEQVTVPTSGHKLLWFGSFLVTVLLLTVGLFWLLPSSSDKVLQAPVPESPVVTDQVTNSNSLQPEKRDYITDGSYLTIDPNCYRFDNPETMSGIISTCDYLGSLELPAGVTAVLKSTMVMRISIGDDDGHRAQLGFLRNGQPLDIIPLALRSYLNINADWFRLKIDFISDQDIFVTDLSGHESVPVFYRLTDQGWLEFKPWELVKEVFPDRIQPPFSINVTESTITITEENYCCENLYSDTPDRVANRMVYVIDRATNKIISTSKIPR